MLNYSFRIELKNLSEVNNAIRDVFSLLFTMDGNLSHVDCYLIEYTVCVAIRLLNYTQGDDDIPPLVAFHTLLKVRLPNQTCVKHFCWNGKSGFKELRDEVKSKKGHSVFSLGSAFPYSFCGKLAMRTLEETVKGEHGAEAIVTLFNKCCDIASEDF